jgi:hypothetical protein
MIQALLFGIHNFIKSILNKEGFPDQWKESIVVPVYKNSKKTDSSNYCEIALQTTAYKIVSNILLSRSSYIDEVIGYH